MFLIFNFPIPGYLYSWFDIFSCILFLMCICINISAFVYSALPYAMKLGTGTYDVKLGY